METDANVNNFTLPTDDPSAFVNYKEYLQGPTSNILPAHGWTSESILYNHLDENIAKVTAKPMSSMAAVIVRRDRPADRASGADAIADAIVNLGLADKNDFTVIPPTPKEGDPNDPILPHTNLIVCNSSQLRDKIANDPTKAIIHTRRPDESDGFTFYLLPVFPAHSWYIGAYVGLSDRLTTTEFLSALFDKLISDREVIQMIQDNHDRIPNAPDLPCAIRSMLEYAQVIPFTVWMPSRKGPESQTQKAVRLYMPPPSSNDAAVEKWKAHLSNPSFTFVVDNRGRATPFKPARSKRGPSTQRAPKTSRIECLQCLGLDHYQDTCPITTSPDFNAVHMNQAELDSVSIGTTLGSIRNRAPAAVDADGFRTVSSRGRPRNGGRRQFKQNSYGDRRRAA
ncbi:hypothetical protein R3P38DRAFT_2615763 [Favolaschia claudopus]|uniref:Uncharacterized protein n=1 Tax=Favolaschia claudopus TaxID=2862362 RepID=A0AAW0CIJ0_9AGAR